MPSGVEHLDKLVSVVAPTVVSPSSMPSGVEHSDFYALITDPQRRESFFDAVRR